MRASRSTEDLMTPLKPEVAGPVVELSSHTHQLSPQHDRHKFKRSIQSSSVLEHTSKTLDPPTIEVGGSPELPGRKVVTLPPGLHGFGSSKSNGKAGGESMKAGSSSPAAKRGHMKSRSLGSK